MSRTVELRIAGQSYRVVSTAPAAELQRLATVINQRLAEIPPQARGPGAQALVLVAISLAHEAEAERHRRESLTARTRELLEGLLRRIDGALDPPMDATPRSPRSIEFHVKQECPPALVYLEDALDELRRRQLFRERPAPHPSPWTTFCSNDYLALAGRRGPTAAAGAAASRLVVGEHTEHISLERSAADLVNLPAALVFTSGYAANVGLLPALAGPDDRIVADALNHASLIDGARLSRARIVRVPHLDLAAVERALAEPFSGRSVVVTESYFSMDADQPDLRALRAICDTHGAALVVDEAHALGVLGPEGRGLCAAAGVRADALVGTFGKAFGAAGAFVAGCDALITWLWNRARTFVFSTGISPALAAAAHAGLVAAAAEPERRQRTLLAARHLRDGLHRLGVSPMGFGHIVPWLVGGAPDALRLATDLRERGVEVRAIRPPSVAEGAARLRFTVTAAHDAGHIEEALGIIDRLLAERAP